MQGFVLFQIDSHSIKAYILIIPLKNRAAIHSVLLRNFTSGKTRSSNCLHFSHNIKRSEFQGPPRLFKMYPVIQHIMFQDLYLLNQDNVIDDSSSIWKCLLTIRQYIPFKAAKLGSKHVNFVVMFGLLHLHWMKHRTNESVYYSRNK